ncbi:hypothetical protein SAMN05216167_13929 [Spirosoma endophyticum]|uniref:Uncharacterized protein n=1 Tax=Spirosoma endophyticum TaxID=662367 RepID=A0A1I2H7M0_9BACT|nr:hypothetical protein SAMN05216167_13929 [Spirosoma endophyticum]
MYIGNQKWPDADGPRQRWAVLPFRAATAGRKIRHLLKQSTESSQVGGYFENVLIYDSRPKFK